MVFLRPLALVAFLLAPATWLQAGEEPPAAAPSPAWERVRGYDRNGDGRVTRSEFRGPERAFDRLDADRDGAITEAEVRRMDARPGRRPAGPPSAPPGRTRGPQALFDRLDANGDGQVSLTEWTACFEQADENGDEILQPEEWEAALGGGAVRDPAPKVGDPAPAVKAQALETGEMVDLSNPERTTVLIFGSHT